MRLLCVLAVVAVFGGCSGDDGPADPNAVTVLAIMGGQPAANKDVTLIGSDGNVQTVKTNSTGYATAKLGVAATQATVFFDIASPEGRYTMQGVVTGDRICLGCTYTTSTAACVDLPQVSNVRRSGQGWTWALGTGAPYLGMDVSWHPAPGNPNAGGHLIAPPGLDSASTSGSADINIVLFTRADVTSYDELRTLSRAGWADSAFCVRAAHN